MNSISNKADSPARTSSPALASLWASAFVIAALIITQAGRLGPANPAHAEMVATGTDYSLLTTSAGNQENVFVLDNRLGRLFVYEPTLSDGLILRDAQDIAEIIQRLQKTPGN